MITVSEALDADTSETITVERFSAGSYVDGLYQKSAATSFKTVASVQQPTPKQLMVLPDGSRSEDARLFISKRSIRTTQSKDGLPADNIIYKGARYKVFSSSDWDSYGHTTVLGVRVA